MAPVIFTFLGEVCIGLLRVVKAPGRERTFLTAPSLHVLRRYPPARKHSVNGVLKFCGATSRLRPGELDDRFAGSTQLQAAPTSLAIGGKSRRRASVIPNPLQGELNPQRAQDCFDRWAGVGNAHKLGARAVSCDVSRRLDGRSVPPAASATVADFRQRGRGRYSLAYASGVESGSGRVSTWLSQGINQAI